MITREKHFLDRHRLMKDKDLEMAKNTFNLNKDDDVTVIRFDIKVDETIQQRLDSIHKHIVCIVGQYDKIIPYYESLLEQISLSDQYDEYQKIKIGILYVLNGNNGSALQYFRQAVIKCLSFSIDKTVVIHKTIGEVYRSKRFYFGSSKHFNQPFEIIEEFYPYDYGKAESHRRIAEVYFDMKSFDL
ncbi:unnamed protein product [Didymodactylos carnosus]|uniref:Tetratricopeptide repeat protein n=1 Tax=Didymodactylos carnosus TaxID=1234261 RepID=A0A815QPW7_9BILA|nr:unnamed protein product [Didymodactylos carnosus]CAF4335711.1 unnamed protein product [Didymodactylos carnosus]